MPAQISEQHFVDQSLRHVIDHLSGSGKVRRVQREVGVGRVIADIVAVVFETDGSEFQLDKPFNITESVLLAALRRRGSTRIDLLERDCGVDPKALRSGVVDRLLDRGFIRKGKGGQISLGSNVSYSATLVAVEAKLHRWKEALKQAIEYQKYADCSYVLLPTATADQAIQNVGFFIEAGIGLWHASNSILTEVVQARRHSEHSWRREYVVSRLLAQNSAKECYESFEYIH